MVADTFYFSYFEVIFHFRSSFIGGHLHLTLLYPLVYSRQLKFQILVRSVQGLSSVGGHLHLIPLYSWVKSYKLKIKIGVRSDQWLLRYSTFHILRSSSILGLLPLEIIFIWYLCILWLSPVRLSFKIDYDLTRGCWDILLFIFWGHLPF